MKRILMSFFFSCAPIAISSQINAISSAEMWWCSGCGLAYPSTQKFCLNKDCPLYRKAK